MSYRVGRPGCRTREVTVITTLLDPAEYPAADLAELYLRRWRVEGCFRTLKHTLGMDELQCRKFAGVLKEVMAYAIAYNLVRLVMARAAAEQGADPWRVSFADAARWLQLAREGEGLPELALNPDRSGRDPEPRALKKRPKGFCRLNKRRELARQELLQKKVVT